jgi:hypothetical protein
VRQCTGDITLPQAEERLEAEAGEGEDQEAHQDGLWSLALLERYPCYEYG